jgi:two-component system, cell cycle response regulator DivK
VINIKDLFYLYVEDEPSNRKVMSLLMEKVIKTSNFVIFSDSQGFLEKIKKLPRIPDVFLLDIHVKPHDGFSMLKTIRDDADIRNSKIIALTASVMNEEIQRLKSAGFDGAIGKPLNLLNFAMLIEQIASGESVWNIS